jgi:hypothetical protein
LDETQGFSPHGVIQAVVLQNMSNRRRQICFAQDVIQKSEKRTSQGTARICKGKLATQAALGLISLVSHGKTLMMQQIVVHLGDHTHCAVYRIVCSVL